MHNPFLVKKKWLAILIIEKDGQLKQILGLTAGSSVCKVSYNVKFAQLGKHWLVTNDDCNVSGCL